MYLLDWVQRRAATKSLADTVKSELLLCLIDAMRSLLTSCVPLGFANPVQRD